MSLTVGSFWVNTENVQKQVFKAYLMNPCYFYNSAAMYTYSDEFDNSEQNSIRSYGDTMTVDFYEAYLVEFYKLHIMLTLAKLVNCEETN